MNAEMNRVNDLLNQGGWSIRSGYLVKKMLGERSFYAIRSSRLLQDGSSLAVELVDIENTLIFSNPAFLVSSEIDHDGLPYKITLKGSVPMERQRKKLEGGGFYQVMEFTTLLTIVHPVRQRAHHAKVEELRRLQEGETAKRREEVEKHLGEDHDRLERERVMQMNAQLKGHVFKELVMEPDLIEVVFEGGVKIVVLLYDREDPCDVYAQATLVCEIEDMTRSAGINDVLKDH